MHRDEKVAPRLETEPSEHPRRGDLLSMRLEHLVDGIADDEDAVAVDALPQEVRAASLGVRHQDVAAVVDHAPVHLFGDAVVVTAISGLEVEDGDAEPLRDHRRERAIRVTQQQEDRKSTRLNSSHVKISYAVFCL